jgi:hypothetical protein
LSRNWEPLPHYYVKLDCRCILQDDAIENVRFSRHYSMFACYLVSHSDKQVEMGDAHENVAETTDPLLDLENESVENKVFNFSKSKWDNQEMLEDRLSSFAV